ncbi:Large-conductance mechanosensitive channel [compost metagenome]
MLKEFKAFSMRGNVVDLAVAVIIGAAFSAIVSSLVADIITPLILNPIMKKLQIDDLQKLSWEGVLYGKFIAAVINFIVVAFCIFIIVKLMNKAMTLRKKEEDAKPAAPPAPSNEEKLLIEIRDLLKNK